MTVEDRNTMIQRLSEDLTGPFEEEEELTSWPSDVYLSGILWPQRTTMGAEEDERLSISGVSGGEGSGSSTGEEEEASKTGMTRPSTAGLSFAVSSHGREPVLSVKVNFALYKPIEEEDIDEKTQTTDSSHHKKNTKWKRHPILIEIPELHAGPTAAPSIELESHGAPAGVYLHQRVASWGEKWLITLTLVNGARTEKNRDAIEQQSLFQVRLEIYPGSGTQLIARPSRRMELDEEQNEEDNSTALLFRKTLEYAVGHTCSAEWEAKETEGTARMVATAWIPQNLVFATNPDGHEIFTPLRQSEGVQPLSAAWLSEATDEELQTALMELPTAYNGWIDLQEGKLNSVEEIYRNQAVRNLEICRNIRDRMMDGATQIGQNLDMAEAFRLANKAMQLQYKWNSEQQDDRPLIWRPFQLGFILLTAVSVADPNHHDRSIMDLLWFPTGGGKTEAYLALIAFLSFYRRFSANGNPDNGDGVTAVMRYTLRLLTTQQFNRASSMILACEAIRRGVTGGSNRIADLGNSPFSIGLWVGGDATPNNFKDAMQSLQGDAGISSPKQLADCPSCKNLLKWYADKKTSSIHVRCDNPECILHEGKTPLPVFTVDDDIYRKRPTLLIGTVDKFAQIVRKKEINTLFSISSGHPPDLIVQDELHLISGPLGTLAGLYEVAIDRMFTHEDIRPKIIGSTATIRRAIEQVRALFNRDACQFPPSAIDAGDSGFAVRDSDAPGKLYTGVTTAGRSAKFTLQAVAASLLQSASGNLTPEGRNHYGTLVSYFNSLRELGGALVLMQDDVNDSIALHAEQRDENRRIIELTEELTSRRTQEEIRDMLDVMAINADKDGSPDVVLATNMMSVGVDIPRLGLMIVNGQPKGISEYIQATGRVGRGHVPGLVVTVLNNAKPRDRSHYESFVSGHSTLYRDVEPTSVTPFASRARDRALHAVLVALVRHLIPGMLDDPPALSPEIMLEIEAIIDGIIARASWVDLEETAVGKELHDLLDKWESRNPKYYWLYWKPKESLLQDAERAAAMRALGRLTGSAWPTMNNLRSVEPSTRFRIAPKLKNPDAVGDGHGHK
ncbi:MAG: hypothetical protein K8R08_07435 [Methanosarcinales archaeon]|nr:hypothetical protein [Methanosarcinales archaeon]